MKRTWPLFVLVGVAGVLVPVFAVFAQTSYTSSATGTASFVSRPPTACAACEVPKTSSGNDKVIDELTAILKETKSPETFLVTAMTLGRMGPEAKRAIPAIIRNAERLEMFEDLFEAKTSPSSRAAEEVFTAIEMILDKKAGAKGRVQMWQTPAANSMYGYGPPPCCAPATPATPAYTPVPGTLAPACPVPPAPSQPAAPAKPKKPVSPTVAN